MCGQEGYFGTSSFQVILDIEEIQKQNAVDENYQPTDEEEEIEKFFGQTTSSVVGDQCSNQKLAIQNNVINIKSTDMGEGDDDYNLF
jgi:hypothetical protein